MLQEVNSIDRAAHFSARELVRSDVTFETLLVGMRDSPRTILALISDVIIKQDSLLNSLARHFSFDATSLVYNHDSLNHIKTLRANGRDVYLIPDLPIEWCRSISGYLKIPLAPSSTESTRDVLAERPYDHPVGTPGADPSIYMSVSNALRLYQWPKNFLVFLPIILAHQLFNYQAMLASIIAFFAIGFAASTIYVLNDLLDLSADRRHPKKKMRPFASGALSARVGVILASFTLLMSLSLGFLLPHSFIIALLCYVCLNLIYTTYLKRKLLLDVLALSGGYTLRIIAGNAATGIELSFWLLAFSLFIFFSLALVKRYVEMDTLGVAQPHEKRVMGRGYRYVDLDMLAQMGVASAFAAVLVLALYVERAGSTGLYTRPELIWLICPIMLYVISRIWFLAKRGEMHHDPVAFILRDWRSHIMGIVVVIVMLAASL